jgi:NAD(P)H-dependent flavin oxidoreductase YrpB (nitropropane dioxygenase family)
MSSLSELLKIRHPIIQSGNPLYAGQSVGVIRDLPSAGDVVRTIADEARRVMQNLIIE